MKSIVTVSCIEDSFTSMPRASPESDAKSEYLSGLLTLSIF